MLLLSWPCQPCSCCLLLLSQSWWYWCPLQRTMSGTLTQVGHHIHTQKTKGTSKLVMDKLPNCCGVSSTVFPFKELPNLKQLGTFQGCFFAPAKSDMIAFSNLLPLFLSSLPPLHKPTAPTFSSHSPISKAHSLSAINRLSCVLSCLPASRV